MLASKKPPTEGRHHDPSADPVPTSSFPLVGRRLTSCPSLARSCGTSQKDGAYKRIPLCAPMFLTLLSATASVSLGPVVGYRLAVLCGPSTLALAFNLELQTKEGPARGQGQGRGKVATPGTRHPVGFLLSAVDRCERTDQTEESIQQGRDYRRMDSWSIF